MHPDLERHIAECRRDDGTLDVDDLLSRVEALLLGHDAEMQRQSHAQETLADGLTAANSRLRESRGFLRSIFEHIPYGLIAKSALDEMSIVLCNRAAVDLFGFAPDEAIGRRAADLMPAHVAEETAADEAQICLDKEPMFKTVHGRNRAGKDLVIEKRLLPLVNEAGVVTHILEIFDDVTALRDQERRLLEAKEQAEAASRAKCTFLATMSHEIRTPMNGVLGMTSLLLDTSLDERQRHFARLIKLSAENLLVIINDILDMSKIEAGRLTLEQSAYDLARVCQAAADIVRTRVDSKGITVSLSLDPGLELWRRGDGDRLRQVLVNLLGNAVKFTDRGSVAACVCEGASPATLRVTVTDTGIGIPREDLGRLFHEFEQVDSSATRRFGGTGLGLAICKKLVVLMGGTIGVESEAGKGSTFWFEIPAPLGVASASTRTILSGPCAAPSASGRLRVLVAEDNPVNQEVVRGYLEWAGCTTTLAGNGTEAVEALRREPFDLVLMDMQMPGMGGVEATSAIRALPGDRGRVPIVMLTANAMAADREASLEAGADEHLAKPIHRARLMDLVARLAAPRATQPTEASARCAPAPADLDRRQFDELASVLGRERLTELLAKARTNLESIAAALGRAASAGDRPELKRLAHSLIGSAGSLALAGTSHAARALEAASATPDADLVAMSERLAATLRRGLGQMAEAVLTLRGPPATPPDETR